MSKKFFTIPLVGLSPIDPGGDVTEPGHGTGEGGSDPFMMSYQEWLVSNFKQDYDFSQDIDENDFGIWWISSGFDYDDWVEFFGNNPPIEWDDGWAEYVD